MAKAAILLIILLTLIAVGLPVAFAWQYLAGWHSITAVKDLVPYVGTLSGAFLGFVALIWAALFNADQGRRAQERIREDRLKALKLALIAEVRQVLAICGPAYEGIQKFKVRRRMQEKGLISSPGSAMVMRGRFHFPSIETIERHLDEIGLLGEEVSRKAFELYHQLQSSRLGYEHYVENNASPEELGDFSYDWLKVVIDSGVELLESLGCDYRAPAINWPADALAIIEESPSLLDDPLAK